MITTSKKQMMISNSLFFVGADDVVVFFFRFCFRPATPSVEGSKNEKNDDIIGTNKKTEFGIIIITNKNFKRLCVRQTVAKYQVRE